MKLVFEVTYQDGRAVVATAMPRDFVAFERQYGKSIQSFSDGALMEWIYYLAWSPLHRTRQEPADFDSFLDIVDNVEPVNDEATADDAAPFETAPTPDSSAP